VADPNGPIRQGTLCRQRIQPSQPEGLALYAPCAPETGRSAQAAGRGAAPAAYQPVSDRAFLDPNGPMRQGTMCKGRIQPSQPEGLARFEACAN
jgi:hypothetical protein